MSHDHREGVIDMLPHDLDAERAVLGAVLITDGAVLDSIVLDEGDLWRDAHRSLLHAMRELRAAGRPVDLVTLRAVLADRGELDRVGGPAYIASLVDGVPRSINAPAYADIVRARATARRAVLLLDRTAARIRESPEAIGNGLPAEHARAWTEIVSAVTRADDGCAAETLPALVARVAATMTRDLLVGDLLALGEIAMLHGQPRDGKTWIALDLAIALAIGGGALGLARLEAIAARRALIVGNEDGAAVTADRLRRLCAGRGLDTLPDTIYLLVGQGVSLDDATWQQRLIDEIRCESIALLILDPLRSVTAAADQGPAELRPVAQYLRRLIGETGCAVLLVHHDVKPQAGAIDSRRRAQRASGGGVFAVVDAPMHVERATDTRTLIRPDGTKHAPDPPPLVVDRQSGEGWVRLVGETASARSADDIAVHTQIVEYLRQSGGGSQRAIVQAVGRHHRVVGAALDALLAAGTVDVADGPRRARLWCLR